MRDLGDFQTPEALAQLVLDKVRGRDFQRVFEPTCGTGNLVEQARKVYPRAEIIGVELQASHAVTASLRFAQDPFIRIVQSNIFDIERLDWDRSGSILVLGNPPWINNTELSRLNSANLPRKSNSIYRSGFEALTGESNFDLAEAIILHSLSLVKSEPAYFVMLCKTSTALRLLHPAIINTYKISDPSIFSLNAQQWFSASCDACLFTFEAGTSISSELKLYSSWDSQPAIHSLCKLAVPRLFRQGIKHDASRVFVLRTHNSGLVNYRGDIVELEADNIYPLYNATDLHKGRYSGRCVVVTQRRLTDDTSKLEDSYPKLWWYLQMNSEQLDSRKSKVYRSRFGMFGVGDYAFLPYKIAVSGFHREPHFNLLRPMDGRPVMVDDTCYYISTGSLEVAERYLEAFYKFIKDGRHLGLLLRGSKRPWTAKLLDLLAKEALQ